MPVPMAIDGEGMNLNPVAASVEGRGEGHPARGRARVEGLEGRDAPGRTRARAGGVRGVDDERAARVRGTTIPGHPRRGGRFGPIDEFSTRGRR
jgi:hypothetical protein